MKNENEIQKLSLEFKKIRQNGGKIIFPLHLKLRVLSLLDEGYSITSLRKKLNLCNSQVYAWKSSLRQSAIPPIKPSYEVKSIPIVQPIAKINNLDSQQNNTIRPKMFFRFFSLKITWG